MQKMKKESGKKANEHQVKDIKNFKNNVRTILIVILIVVLWRGIWGLMDLYLFPNMLPLSFVLSIFFGLIILLSVKRSWKILE